MKDNEKKEIAILTERVILGQTFRIYGTVENPMFLLKDIADFLGLTSTTELAKRLSDNEKNKFRPKFNLGLLTTNNDYWFVTEQGLYKILMRSDKPNAQPFQDKVCEILTEIRQTGGYIHTNPDDDDDIIMAKALVLAQRKIELRNKQLATAKEEIKKQQEQLALQAPKVGFCDEVLNSYSSVTTTVIAQDYGMSAQKFNKLLNKMHIQYKQGNTWVLYSEHKGKGYTESETIVKHGYSVISTRWTQKGRKLIYETLKEAGILPIKEIEE